MTSNFKITAITKDLNHLFNLHQDALDELGAIKMKVDEKPGFPCRVSLEDANIGEEVLLFPYNHHDTNSPYQASGPIFIRKNVAPTNLDTNEIPEMLLHRLLSLRIYNNKGIMIDAKTVKGIALKDIIKTLFKNEAVSYGHIHNSGPGCYNCQIERVTQ